MSIHRTVALIAETSSGILDLSTPLSRLGEVDVEWFMSIKDFAKWQKKHKPQLILADLSRGPSLELLRLLEKSEEAPPKILMVARTDEDKSYYAASPGVGRVLTWPISPIEIHVAAREALQHHQNTRSFPETARAYACAASSTAASTRVQLAERDVVQRLTTATGFRDPETGAHLERMSQFAKLIAAELGMSRAFQDLLLEAAPMHDIGKVGIPDNILLKPGRLTADEYQVMKRHAEIGYEILKGSDSALIEMAAVIAWTHHEKFDGSGYPRGLSGTEIPLVGRIVAIADVFDALTSPRPYKKSWSIDEASQLIRDQSGKHFDPECVEAFFGALGRMAKWVQPSSDELPQS